MKAKIFHFNDVDYDSCEKGSSFEFYFTWKDSSSTVIALSTYTIKMQVRDNYSGDVIIEFSAANSNITVDSNEEVEFYLTPAQTALLTEGKYVYDLEVTSPVGRTYKLLKGEFNILPEVTV